MFRETAHQIDGDITIRRLGADDAASLQRLAERDSAQVPEGPVYAAITPGGAILAAISLESGTLVADPFAPSAHAAALLRVWARELDGASTRRWMRGRLAVATTRTAPTPTATPC